ncbi:hypothetical protein QTP70_031409 [Hemibagrus guttatus]|uniref:Uncharacterized protein n=1 Tax=Hemibagrus guttatus TaxID=175788 RepID=A0AAE0VBX4_9TELE|nr:hypothetical protein QTP70_031409 [Hemibagrus guttatus]
MIATHKRVSGNLVFIPMNSGNKAGDNLVPRHYKPPSPVSHLPPQQEPPLRPPECFSGDPQKIISFLTQCCIQFRLQSSAFPMEESKTLAFSCKWDSQALMDMFFCGLSEKVKDEMAARDPPPDLNRLVEMAVRIDCQIQVCNQERVSRIGSTPRPSSNTRPTIIRFSPRSSIPITRDLGEPMQIGREKQLYCQPTPSAHLFEEEAHLESRGAGRFSRLKDCFSYAPFLTLTETIYCGGGCIGPWCGCGAVPVSRQE